MGNFLNRGAEEEAGPRRGGRQFIMTRKNRGEKSTNFLLYCKSESRVLPLKIKLVKLEAKWNDEYWTLFNEDVIDRKELLRFF